MGDTDIADDALPLQVAQQRQLVGGVDQVVHLDQVELVAAERLLGLPQLAHGRFVPLRADLGGQEGTGPQAAFAGQQRAGDGFRLAIAGRGVDEGAPRLQEDIQHLGQRRHGRGVGWGRIEGVRSAQADDGQRLAGGRDGPGQHGGRQAERAGGPRRAGQGGAGGGQEEVAAVRHGEEKKGPT
ncbi:hypothetical protein D9M68_666700 [compost metagenome]